MDEQARRRFERWQLESLAGGETAKAGLFGKTLGLLGLDADGNRAATSWTDAAKHTAGNLINAPQDIGNQLLDLKDYQPVYGTGASNPEDRARAGQQAVSTFGLAGLAPLGGMAVGKMAGVSPIENNAAGVFGGRLARTADHQKLATAEEMAARGVPREQIWKETGWFTGADGKWRFEIDDSGQKLRKTLDELDRSNPMPSDMVFSHDQLYQAYPQVGDIPWYRTPSMEGGGGSYDTTRGIRVGSGEGLASGKNGVGGVTLHEQQHAVQGIEGFAKGGNRDMGHPRADVERMAREAYEANRTRPRDADDALLAELGMEVQRPTKPWDELTLRQQMEWWDAGRGRAYHHLAGEAEARTVQKRMDLTADQRAARPPWLDYDVPENQQIVRFNANSKEGAVPGLGMTGQSEQNDPYRTALQMQARRKLLGLPY